MTTQQRNLLIGAVVIVAIAGAVMLYMQGGDITQPPAAETESEQAATQTGNTTATKGAEQLSAADFSWEFRESEEKDDVPQTRVSLVHEGGPTLIGTYAGSCSAIDAEKRLPGEITAVLCWYAGGGDEIGVFREGTKYVVKAGVQEESTVDSAGFRGSFKTVLTLD